MDRPSGCQATYSGGQYACSRCGFTWDLDDGEPPECIPAPELSHKRGREALNNLKDTLKDEKL